MFDRDIDKALPYEVLELGGEISDIEDVDALSLVVLEEFLARIDDALMNYRLSDKYHYQLLRQKEFLLNRANEIKRQDLREFLRSSAPEGEYSNSLEAKLDELESAAEDAQMLSKEIERVNSEIEREKLKAELFERRSRVWLSFIERESVATIIGSLLLVLLSCSLVTAMFIDVEPSDIINNGFLVLLGYFFGQITSRAINRRDTQNS